MLFSVIIPTYNRANWLREAVESVLNQTFGDFELIVVDDGSTDGTGDLVRSLGAKAKLITQANLGAGAARNAGARQAGGDYLAFLDSDDVWTPWTLESFAEAIEQHGRPAILGSKMMEFNGDSPLKTLSRTSLQTKGFADYIASYDRPYSIGAGMSVLDRKAFLKIGGYTERQINLEDHDLVLRMGNSPGFVQITSPVTLAYRRHASGATMNLRRNIQGAFYLLDQERLEAYPGGKERQWERRKIITRHIRPISLACLREKSLADGWHLYQATAQWHLRLGRWKYLAGFPVKAMSKT